MFNTETDMQKWAPILEHKDAPAFQDPHRKAVTAKLLENTEKALQEEKAQAGFLNENNVTTAAVDKFDPVLISLVRRAMPNLIAYDVAGVQPMSGPTGLIFAMKARYNDGANETPNSAQVTTGDNEALHTNIDTAFSGTADDAGVVSGHGTAVGETLGGTGPAFGDMGFTIEKAAVEAKTRGLKAEYTMELAQDLKAVHGLDAESELANILSTEILAEINREVIDTINSKAKAAPVGDQTVGEENKFDLQSDADGRWAVEKFQSLIFQIEVEANKIATDTRRGKGNFIICSANVASALAAAGSLDTAQINGLNVDATGNTFAGTLNGRIKVYVDPYALVEYVTVGYRGTNPYDAGLFYCPYVPLTMVRAVDESTFQPKIGFKTRYGMVKNPFVEGVEGAAATNAGVGTDGQNQYFRRFLVENINVQT